MLYRKATSNRLGDCSGEWETHDHHKNSKTPGLPPSVPFFGCTTAHRRDLNPPFSSSSARLLLHSTRAAAATSETSSRFDVLYAVEQCRGGTKKERQWREGRLTVQFRVSCLYDTATQRVVCSSKSSGAAHQANSWHAAMEAAGRGRGWGVGEQFHLPGSRYSVQISQVMCLHLIPYEEDAEDDVEPLASGSGDRERATCRPTSGCHTGTMTAASSYSSYCIQTTPHAADAAHNSPHIYHPRSPRPCTCCAQRDSIEWVKSHTCTTAATCTLASCLPGKRGRGANSLSDANHFSLVGHPMSGAACCAAQEDKDAGMLEEEEKEEEKKDEMVVVVKRQGQGSALRQSSTPPPRLRQPTGRRDAATVLLELSS